MKSSLKLMGRSLVAAGALMIAAISSAQPMDKEAISAEEKKATLTKVESMLLRFAFVPNVDFKKWPTMVKEKQDEIDKATTVGSFTMVINQIMDSYGFSHILLFSPEQAMNRASQSRAGIGIRIEIEPNGIRVVRIFDNSPAAEVGLQPGDLIVESDGKPVRGVVDLAGDEGQTSKIVLERDGKKITKSVTRRKYSTVIPETLTWKGDTAVVTIPTFDAAYNRERIESIFAELTPKAKSVVLDLRGNGGGRVVNLQHLAGFFLDPASQPMGTFVGRLEYDRFGRENNRTGTIQEIAEATRRKVVAIASPEIERLKVPVAALIDGASGSGSEIMAGALREQLGAKLYGRRSAGAVLASLIQPIGDDLGFLLQYPVTDYVTIKGLRIEGNGVQPDFSFPIGKFGEPDRALDAAVEGLKAARM